MIPSFHRPVSVAQALQLKAELGTSAVFLAGGTEVNNLHAPRPTALIDISGLGLGTIERTGAGLRVGATVTFQQLMDHEDTPWFLKAAAGQMTNRNVRNRATVGGQLATNRSCADLIPTLLAASAQVTLVDREVPVEQFLAGEPELILSLFVPLTDRAFGHGNQTRTASDISIVTVSASLYLDGDRVQQPILAVGGTAPHVVRLHEVEDVLHGQTLPAAEAVESLISQAVHPIDDLRGSAAYKRQLAAVLGQRALRAALRSLLSETGAP